MKTLILSKTGNVGKVVGEFRTVHGIMYSVQPLTYSSYSNDYLVNTETTQLWDESHVECIDTNIAVIKGCKSRMFGFDSYDDCYYG